MCSADHRANRLRAWTRGVRRRASTRSPTICTGHLSESIVPNSLPYGDTLRLAQRTKVDHGVCTFARARTQTRPSASPGRATSPCSHAPRDTSVCTVAAVSCSAGGTTAMLAAAAPETRETSSPAKLASLGEASMATGTCSTLSACGAAAYRQSGTREGREAGCARVCVKVKTVLQLVLPDVACELPKGMCHVVSRLHLRHARTYGHARTRPLG